MGAADRQVVQRDLNELIATANDFLARAKNTRYEHFSDLCQTMFMLASTLKKEPEESAEKSLKLLVELSKGIQVAFEEGGTDERDGPRSVN